MMIGHPFYLPPPKSPAAVAFREADILDFLGDIGIARIFDHRGARLHAHAGRLAQDAAGFADTFPAKLTLRHARILARPRVEEMRRFFDSLEKYGFGGKAL